MKILLHICCAPCTIYPHEILTQKFEEVVGLFYNPNIHPYLEFLRRIDSIEKYSKITNLKVIYKREYPLEDYLRQIAFRENKRCFLCYTMRLEFAASLARHGKFDAFTTTLLYSKQQKHNLIIDICETMASKYKIKFFYMDFRKGWKIGIEKSKRLGLYRQPYCGCIYSEKDRFHHLKEIGQQAYFERKDINNPNEHGDKL